MTSKGTVRFQIIAVFTALCLSLALSCSPALKEKPSTVSPPSVSDKSYAVASWYGKEFHGRPTSSGIPFDMYAYTCAHKEYPFGTQLNITNISNNRSVECVVNDRGPFIEGRDIDLSYAAAKEIGLIGTGLAKVSLEVRGRDSSYIKQAKMQVADSKGPFVIQLGAFAEGVNAVRLKTALSIKFSNVYIQEAEIRGTVYHRVRIGNFDVMKEARDIAEQLGWEGYQPVIMKADVKI